VSTENCTRGRPLPLYSYDMAKQNRGCSSVPSKGYHQGGCTETRRWPKSRPAHSVKLIRTKKHGTHAHKVIIGPWKIRVRGSGNKKRIRMRARVKKSGGKHKANDSIIRRKDKHGVRSRKKTKNKPPRFSAERRQPRKKKFQVKREEQYRKAERKERALIVADPPQTRSQQSRKMRTCD